MKIVAAMITAGEPSLKEALASIRPHVDEVVGVLTDPTKADSVFPLFDECHIATAFNWPLEEGGGLRDFGAARNLSFDIAASRGADFLVWCDSDDELISGENLRPALEALKDAPRARILAKYEYAYDFDRNEVCVEQWRERAIKAGTPYRWHRPVHEHLVADDGDNADVKLETVVWRHRREIGKPWSDRNLRILRWHFAERGEAAIEDAWLRLNLGLELYRAGEFEDAIWHLAKYVTISGRDDEKAMACVTASRAALALGPMDPMRQAQALEWTERAIAFRDCFESRFAEAQVRFVRGAMGDLEEMYQAASVLMFALDACGATTTPQAVSPIDFHVNAPEMLRVACASYQNWPQAAHATRLLLKARPDDELAKWRLRHYSYRCGNLDDGLDIVIACGATIEEWNPATAAAKGIGGSETAVIEVSKRLAAMGHRVRVIADCGDEAVYDGVLWQPHIYMNEIDGCDVAICWRDAYLTEFCRNAKVRVVWAHDVRVANMTPERARWVDRVLGLSDWHCANLRSAHRLGTGQVTKTRNGIDTVRFVEWMRVGLKSGFVPDIVRNPHRVIYSSSPDRGLAVLLDLWPRIRAQVPDATLDVFYGFGGLDDQVARTGDQNLRYYSESLKRRMRELPGVTHHGRVDQRALAREMLASGVFAYPTHWVETSCISAMEAQAAGLRIVTTKLAALTETVGDRGVLIDGDWLSEDYQTQFVEAVVDAMLAPEGVGGWPMREKMQAYARENFSWNGVAKEWDAMFRELLEDAEYGVLPDYMAVAE